LGLSLPKSILSVFFLSGFLANAQSFVTGQAARAEIGQPQTFSTGQSGTEQNLIGGASGLAYANGMLWVADSNRLGASPQNNRVLGYPTGQIPGPYTDLSQVSNSDSACGLCGFGATALLGQPDYVSSNPGRAATATPANGSTASVGSMSTPTAVATDGTYLAVADTDNNRVLIWNTIPAGVNAAPNVVLGQKDFTSFQTPQAVNANLLRGPQGVWIQNGALFVADTQNYRVLVWKHIPTQNNQPADLVLGQPNFTTANGPTISLSNPFPPTAANLLLNPASVTSDGTRLFVADLGNNRVLIWNNAFVNGQLALSNDQGADVAVGQPLLTTAVANWSSALCGAADNTAPCAATLNFPRFALSDGKRLFIADGGNDRVLIYNTIPTQSGASADIVLGQVDFVTDQDTSATISITSTLVDNTSAVNITPNPTSLAFDGTNLYVADPYNRRVLVFTPGDMPLPDKSVVNWASEIIRQEGIVTFAVPAGGTITAGDTVTVTIQGTAYTYTEVKGDTVDTIAKGIVNAINSSNSGAGDPYATAIFAGAGTGAIYLASKAIDPGYDSITLAASTSNTSNLVATASGGYLTAGNAGTGAAGMLVEINGTNLSDNTTSALMNGNNLPTSLGGVEVFMDGLVAPVLSVSPTQIISEIPFTFINGSLSNQTTIGTQSVSDRNSTSIYVRTTHSDGSVTVTTATPMYIAPANPGLFNAPAYSGQTRPWPVINAYHQPGNPTAVVSVDGTVTAGNMASITIGANTYTYTVVSGDTLLTIAQNLINLINNAPDPNVRAALGGAFQRIVLTALQSGQAGTGIAISASASAGATVTLTPYTSSTCCNVVAGSLITQSNPAVPGELISVSATGLGAVQDVNGNVQTVTTGAPWQGAAVNSAVNSVNATMNGVTAEVITAGLVQNGYGMYSVQMVVPSTLSTNAATQLYIAQNAFISNTVTIPIGAPGTPTTTTPGSGLGNAQILVNPTVLVLNAGTGSLTQSQSVTVNNPNGAMVQVTGVSITGTNAAQFQYATNCQGTLTQTCNITVTYRPGSAAVATASLVISDNVSGSSQSVSLVGVSGAQYEIANKLSGRVLDVLGASTADGAPVQQFDYLGGNNQKWTLVPVGGNAYSIMNMNSGKVLDVTGASTSNGTTIQQWDYLGNPNQQWTFQPTANGFYAIVNVGSGLALDDTGYSLSNGTIIQQWQFLSGDNQQWALLPTQTYRIVNLNSGKVLDDTGYSIADGNLIQQWDYTGSTNQQWQFIPVDGTYYEIKNVLSGKVLDVIGLSLANGTLIQQYDYQAGDNQKWAFVPTDVPGSYAIVNKLSGRVLDVIGFSTQDGTQIQQYDYLGGPNQKWQIIANQ
jgi:uncharacterized protein (TIGR03437 family)